MVTTVESPVLPSFGRQHLESQSPPQSQEQSQSRWQTQPQQTHPQPSSQPQDSSQPQKQQSISSLSSKFESPFPPLTRSSTVPASLRSTATTAVKAAASVSTVRRADPYHLAPEDAFYTSVSPPWDRSSKSHNSHTGSTVSSSDLRESRASRQSLRPGGAVLGTKGGNVRRTVSGALAGGADSRSRSRRRRRRTWKKLLWVKQSYPDNYTDQATFLENLQRNPRLQPYDFWPLVADSTVIVQHVCSVIIFVVCFVGIFQERVSPVSVVGWGSIATCIGWLLWEWWAGQEQSGDGNEDGRLGGIGGGIMDDGKYQRLPPRYRELSVGVSAGTGTDLSSPHLPPHHTNKLPSAKSPTEPLSQIPSSASSSTTSLFTMSNKYSRTYSHSHSSSNGNGSSVRTGNGSGLGSADKNGSTTSLWQPVLHAGASQASTSSAVNGIAQRPPSSHGRSADHPPATPATPRYPPPPRRALTPSRDGRTHHRIATIKSAVLIYFTLLGLSPILKSLTRSTSSDSIWAMSFWLLAINIFFFDYSGVWVGAHKFPVASLSTNAALMASTVLASRLPSTGQVFSLTLFSIEVFGLFPVFRRYARHRSWRYHVGLTVLLVLGAGAGVGIILTGGGEGLPWRSAVAGMVVACLLAAVAMGGCSWWLIGLQKYKNEIYGPWDPARPIIISRRHWNDV